MYEYKLSPLLPPQRGNNRTPAGTSPAAAPVWMPAPAAPPTAATGADGADSPVSADFLNFTDRDLVKSIILSEVLGKPRSMRRGRW